MCGSSLSRKEVKVRSLKAAVCPREANEGLPERVDVVARHACQTVLAAAFDNYPEFICTDHLEKCFNHSQADIPEHEATFATACFCGEDR